MEHEEPITTNNIFEEDIMGLKEMLLNRADYEAADCVRVLITPEMAEEWLTHNHADNRTLRKSTVNKYVNDMKNGNWTLNTDCVAFDTEGRLIQGQHRLHAVVKSGLSEWMHVMFEFDNKDSAMQNFDRGAMRNLADIIRISGIDDDVYANGYRTVNAYMRLKLGNGHFSQNDTIDFIKTNYKVISKALEISKITSNGNKGKMQASVSAAILSALVNDEPEEALHKFVQVYSDMNPEGCDDYNAQIALRLRETVKSKRNLIPRDFQDIERSINAFACNKQRLSKSPNVYPVKLKIRDK